MAEGLEDAADLFRNEIAPGSERPRDDSGRFTGAASRPEPMFEPRSLEGDEKTGDTRDGGDDERLKAIERRVADGRAEEGDADELARVSDDAARTRDADGEGKRDGRHDPEGGDGVAKGGDEGDAEEAPDEDAARWALTYDGKPVEKIEIDVGGETKQVSLQEVVKGYAEQEAINQRAARFEEHARAFEQQSTAVVTRRSARPARPTSSGLEYIGRVMADLYPKGSTGSRNTPPIRADAPTRRRKSSSTSAALHGVDRPRKCSASRPRRRARSIRGSRCNRPRTKKAAYAEWGKQEFRRRTGITDTADAEQRICSDAQGRPRGLRLQRTGDRDRL